MIILEVITIQVKPCTQTIPFAIQLLTADCAKIYEPKQTLQQKK